MDNVHNVLFAVLILLVIKVDASCMKGMDDGKVAKMCYESEASGTSVYIDTSGAQATDNSSGPLCRCNVTFQNAKLFNMTVTGQDSVCGSKLNFQLDNTPFSTNETCKEITRSKLPINQSGGSTMEITLVKTKAPFVADFCTDITLELCSKQQYQCDDGVCIQKSVTCDGLPDCKNGDDESATLCRTGVCSEGQVSCRDGKGCFSSSEKCDNKTNCSDSSDEQGCYTDDANGVTTTVPPDTGPLVHVFCYESDRFSTKQTTTSTSTTTTSTTTATTATTTLEDTTVKPTEAPSTKPKQTTTEVPPFVQTVAVSEFTTQLMYTNATHQRNISDYVTIPPEEGQTMPLLKNPYVLAGIILAAVVLTVAVTSLIVYAIRRQSRTQSKDISNDLWISNTQEKELEPMNPL